MSQEDVIHNISTEEDATQNVWNLGNLREALNEKQEEEESQRNVTSTTVLHSPPVDDKNRLVEIWNEGRDSSRNKLWCTIANNPITSYDFSTLRRQQELNDVIINSYLELLSKRCSSSPSHPNCRFFISFFYTCLVPRLGSYDYSRVRRWTSKANINILDYDKIFIPLNLPGHWVLTVINLFEKRFELYDSLHGRSNHHLKVLKRYLMDEIKDKAPKFLSSPSFVSQLQRLGLHSDLSNLDSILSWPGYLPTNFAPQLASSSDCGVFLCAFADYCSRHLSVDPHKFDFTSTDMNAMRISIGIRLLHQNYYLQPPCSISSSMSSSSSYSSSTSLSLTCPSGATSASSSDSSLLLASTAPTSPTFPQPLESKS